MINIFPVFLRFMYLLLWIGIIITFIAYFAAFPIVYTLSGIRPKDLWETFAVIENKYFNSI